MSAYYKLSAVLAGYTVALLAAFVACYVLQRLFPVPDPAGGMQAFGDMLRFLGIFGLLALFPTALALYFLRPVEKFWTVFSIASLALAATGPSAALILGRPRSSPWLALFGFFGLLQVLAAPLLGVAYVICALVAPVRRPRLLLLAASAIEFAVATFALFRLLVVGHWAS
jgi:hypothetical protein